MSFCHAVLTEHWGIASNKSLILWTQLVQMAVLTDICEVHFVILAAQMQWKICQHLLQMQQGCCLFPKRSPFELLFSFKHVVLFTNLTPVCNCHHCWGGNVDLACQTENLQPIQQSGVEKFIYYSQDCIITRHV